MAYKRNMDNIKKAKKPTKLSEGPRKESTGTVAGIVPPRKVYRETGNPEGFM